MDRKTKGKEGEDLAEMFLVEKGHEILERNFRHRRSEIDMISLENAKLLVFIEIKLRKSNDFGEPESFVSDNQSKKIIEAAEEYIHNINWTKDIRFDIISINEQTSEITHIKDAFH